MTVIITITADEIIPINNNFYNYCGEDRILKNIITNDYEVFYSGQNQGRMDYQLINNVNSLSTFRIYYRKKKNTEFIFLGSTSKSSIIKERIIDKGKNTLPNERLQIRLVISKDNVRNIKIYNEFEGIGCYKKSVLNHSNFPTNLNTNLGFYTN